MSKLVMIFCIVFSSFTAWADDITVTIDGQTYVCSGSGGSCAGKVSGFRATLDACLQKYSGAHCFSSFWPKFKSRNPGCIDDAIPECLRACKMNHDAGYCASNCQ